VLRGSTKSELDGHVYSVLSPIPLLKSKVANAVALPRKDRQDVRHVRILVKRADAKRTYDSFFALHERLEKLLDRRVDLVTDKSLTETKARLILPTVRYAAHHG